MKSYISLKMILIGAAMLVVAGCASSSKVRDSNQDSKAALQARIDRILTDPALARTVTGVKVSSLRHEENLYERNADLLFHPASNQKLLISSAALSILGPDHELVTTVACDTAARQDSVIHGDLYLIGGGDPDLTTKDLFEIVQQLESDGLRSIAGDIVCDDSYFDDVRWGSGWMWDDEPSPLWARFTALTLNDNAIVATVKPAAKAGMPAKVVIEPENEYVKVINNSVTVDSLGLADSLGLEPLSIGRQWQQHENTFVIEGAIGLHEKPHRREMNVLEPQILAGHVLRNLLLQAGIRVSGGVEYAPAPDSVQSLARFERALLPVLINLNKISDNLTAEQLFKVLGAERYGPPGTGEKGRRAVRTFLAEAGVDTLAIRTADGSGVSRYNLVTPAEIVKLLQAMWNNFKVRNEFISTLPIAGVDGTLGGRMHATAAEGIVHAKTGTLSGVSTLSGYATTAEGEEIVFSIMMQHFLSSASAIRQVQDRICAEITAWRRIPRTGQDLTAR